MNKRVSFLDLRILEKQEKKDLLEAVKRVFTHGRIILGPEVEELEQKVANFCGRKYAVGVNSGTDALILGLKSIGVGAGDEVITTSLSWVATANAIAILGATPVFADILDDLNIDSESVERLVTSRTKAIMPVHYTGRVCNMNGLFKIARKHNLMVIEDAAQSFGAAYKDRRAGSFGKVSCFSMNPMKVFAACGEAGMVLTDEEEIYKRLMSLRYNGTINKEECIEVSLNGRIDTLQAAILLERFKRFKKIIRKRRENAVYYNRRLKRIKGIIELPTEGRNEKHVYYTYTIRAKKRDRLKKFLEEKGVETKIQHPFLMSEQPVYKNCPKDKLKRGVKIVKEILCLPANEKILKEEMDYVVICIREFYNDRI